MFLNKIKRVFHKSEIKKGKIRPKTQQNATKIESVAFLIDASKFTAKELQEIINLFDKNFSEILTKNIFFYKKNATKNHFSHLPTFTMKDFSIFGNIKGTDLKQFIDTQFDLLINFFNSNDVSLHSIAMKSEAKFKVGLSNKLDAYNDMVIKTDKYESEIFFPELQKYLKILQKIA